MRGKSARRAKRTVGGIRLRLVDGRLVYVVQLDKPLDAYAKGYEAYGGEKDNQTHSYFSLIFDNAMGIKPETKHSITDIPPMPNSSAGFTLSYFMMPASITPPKTSLAMSIRNYPLSDKIVSLLPCFIIANIRKVSLRSGGCGGILNLIIP